MHALLDLPLCAAGLTAILAAAAGGLRRGRLGHGARPARSTAAAASPLDAVQLAAKTTSGASSFTGTMSLQATAKPGAPSSGNVSMTATMAEQLRPSLLAEVQIGTLSAAGQTLPGGMSEIITPSDLYLKWPVLTQELHTGKPWLVIPVSALSKSSGINFSQLFSQATSSQPAQRVPAARRRQRRAEGRDGDDRRRPGDRVHRDRLPRQGMQYLTGSAKTAMQKEIAAAGLTTATFTVWVDGQHGDAQGRHHRERHGLTEVVTVTITSVNQPVNIPVPAADQTTPLPSGALGSLGCPAVEPGTGRYAPAPAARRGRR